MLKELWEKIKGTTRKARDLQYVKDTAGKEIKFGIRAPKGFTPSKHQASKKGSQHIENSKPERSKGKTLTNHQRVVASRARKQGISVAEYQGRYQKEE